MGEINFGVNTRCLQITMAEMFADFFEGDALIDKPRGTSVAQRVRPVMFNGDIKRLPATSDSLTDGSTRECPERSPEGEKQFAAGWK